MICRDDDNVLELKSLDAMHGRKADPRLEPYRRRRFERFAGSVGCETHNVNHRRPKIEARATICSCKTPSCMKGSSAAAISASNLACPLARI